MLRAIGVTAAVVTVLGLTACSDSSDEPTGLAADTDTPASTGTPAPSETPSATAPPTNAGSSDPTAESETTPANTFTQPYLPEERVVELRESVPVEPPADASDQEAAVVASFAHVQAAWEQILWGVPVEQTHVAEHSTGVHLDTMRDYAQESVDLKRVSVGPPLEHRILSVEAGSTTGSLEFCMGGGIWTDIYAEGPPKTADELYLGTMNFEQVDGAWKSTRVEYAEDVTQCEGMFE
ncbi:hypothetical protein CLV30_102175 [Haloactinopolyspora alba]|uniref:Lipoprotein n=1 Tax=Haloactinopolyspora alba TaxID=648780 RepID=A0A2P8EBI0_9ACTN|nr:hypothetical protein [Haloactinopolyspora alba]PSL06787.1 hypothetical protein CLV30_102175 [Haloactinopolyspora alba]